MSYFNKKEIFEVDPDDVVLDEDLPRYRKEVDQRKLKKLLRSMEKYGQFVPIIVTRDMRLVAGGRRLAACKMGQRKVRCIYIDAVDPLVLREIELEENLQRENLTPAEEALAIRDLHNIKQKLYGESQSGREGGWTLDKTAESLGVSRAKVIEHIQIAEAVETFPELAKLKNKSAIKRAARSIDAAVRRAELARQVRCEWDLHLADAREWMPTVPDRSVDLLLTDPPYGIDIDEVAMHIGRKTGGVSTAGYKFTDKPDKAFELYTVLARESFRFCKGTAHAWIFVAPEYFHAVRTIFEAVGWLPHVRPIIWVKRAVGQCNAPKCWPASCYDMLLYCRRPDSELVLQGRPDWIQVPPVEPSKRIHPAEKPVELLRELIQRTVMPNSVVCDPFAGSASTFRAALSLKMRPVGCEVDKAAYAAALEALSKEVKS